MLDQCKDRKWCEIEKSSKVSKRSIFVKDALRKELCYPFDI